MDLYCYISYDLYKKENILMNLCTELASTVSHIVCTKNNKISVK